MLTSTAALVADALWNMPLVMPVPIALGPGGARLLPAGTDEADYTVHALDAPPLALPPAPDASDHPSDHPSVPASARADANTALDDMEAAARLSEYHDFDWWRERIARARAGLQP